MFKRITTPNGNYSVYGFPDRCPVCHEIDDPNIIYAHLSRKSKHGSDTIIAICTCCNCRIDYAVSFSLHHEDRSPFYTAASPKTLPYSAPPVSFNKHILEISPTFVNIYNQSMIAKNTGLDELVGMGFRKALEFLIKDYLLYIAPSDKDDIKSKFLGKCIKDDVTNPKIKSVAERAAWLGNDQTHYVQKFSEHDVDDLLRLINLTVYWISAELETKEWDLLQPQK